ncbi:MAG: arginase family protein [Rikenellaceae bacterium]
MQMSKVANYQISPELRDFDPNGVGVVGEGFFALPSTVANSRVSLLMVPWDVTVSYRSGTAAAPAALLEASAQLDLYDSSAQGAWREGIATLPMSEHVEQLSQSMRPIAERVIAHLEGGGAQVDAQVVTDVERVNQASREMNKYVYDICSAALRDGKIVGVVGGDHSTPYGAMLALSEVYDSFGVLHIDAHRDLREGYEGFEFSHASVMYNVLRDCESIERLVQVGVRDFCDREQALAERDDRVVNFEDLALARAMFEGATWRTLCDRIVESLPQRVYVSFDIDGLELAYAPHTGTPVGGGLSYNQAIYLLERVVESGREIIGFDVVEVVPHADDVTDLVVGTRMIYKLCGLAIKSMALQRG